MKTDEGPAKVAELIGVLRAIVVATAVTIVIVHHDVKPTRDGQDQRRRGQRASGGDWFAGCECPVHVERVSDHETLVYPQDYKFSADPAPFTFTCDVEDGLIARLVGTDITSERAPQALRAKEPTALTKPALEVTFRNLSARSQWLEVASSAIPPPPSLSFFGGCVHSFSSSPSLILTLG